MTDDTDDTDEYVADRCERRSKVNRRERLRSAVAVQIDDFNADRLRIRCRGVGLVAVPLKLSGNPVVCRMDSAQRPAKQILDCRC